MRIQIVFLLFASFHGSASNVSARIHELGATLKNSTTSAHIDTRIMMTIDAKTGIRLVSSYLTVDTRRNKASLTTASYRTDKPFPFTARGCLPAYFINHLDWQTISSDGKHQLNNFQYTILLIDKGDRFGSGSIDQAVLNEFSRNKVIVASFNDSPLNDAIERQLIENSVIVVSNLVRPKNDELDTSRSYFGYILVYDAFRNQTGTEPVPFLSNLVLVEKNANYVLCGSPNREGRHLEVLSHDFGGKNPIYPGYVYPSLDKASLTFLDHYSTHIDAPYHLFDSRMSSDQIPLDYSLLPSVKVIANSEDSENFKVNKEVFSTWERQARQKIPERAIVLVDTGYYKFWNEPNKYSKLNSQTQAVRFPGIDPSAIEWLIQERNISAVGIDTLSTDPGNSTDLATHIVLARNSVLGIENVGKLDWFPNAKGEREADRSNKLESHAMNPIAHCMLVYLRSERGTGAPLAIFAHIERDYSASASKSSQQATKRSLFTTTYIAITIIAFALLSYL